MLTVQEYRGKYKTTPFRQYCCENLGNSNHLAKKLKSEIHVHCKTCIWQFYLHRNLTSQPFHNDNFQVEGAKGAQVTVTIIFRVITDIYEGRISTTKN